MSLPYECVEIGATLDENRPLLDSGLFAVEMASAATIKRFRTADDARAAGERAPNRRPGYPLYVPGDEKHPILPADTRAPCDCCGGSGNDPDDTAGLCEVCNGVGRIVVPGEIDCEAIEGRPS